MTLTYSQLGKNGRLGNQLFQIASTIGIAAENKIDFIFPEWAYANYFKNKLPTYQQIKITLAIQEAGYNYSFIILDSNGVFDLNGYFQSYKYFDKSRNVVEHYLELKNPFPFLDVCSVHIRRGDYLERSNFHTNLSIDYYKEAMLCFPKETGFLFFSDDLNWCKENFIGPNIFYSTNKNEVEDLFYMASCKHHIIANSSFSWWAAYLGNAGKTIAPKNWFQTNLDTKDLYLPEWIKI